MVPYSSSPPRAGDAVVVVEGDFGEVCGSARTLHFDGLGGDGEEIVVDGFFHYVGSK